MKTDPIPAPAPPPAPGVAQRLSQRWYWVMPNLAVLLFVLAMSGLLWLLRAHESEQQLSSLVRDVQWAEQAFRLHLQGNQESLLHLARDIGGGAMDEESFHLRADQLIGSSGEIARVMWIDADARVRWQSPADDAYWKSGQALARSAETDTFRAARDLRRARYSALFSVEPGDPLVAVHVPVFRQRQFVGTVAAVYSVRTLVFALVPVWFAEKYELAVLDANGDVVATTSRLAPLDKALAHEISFEPFGHGLRLRSTAFKAGSDVVRNMLFGLVFGLSLVIIWSLWALRRYMAYRRKAEEALRVESAFRKSMEDSTLTGLRVIDMAGRISYVNPAFCRMTGYSEPELLGRGPPFPYWPPEEEAHCWNALRTTLSGNAPENGMEVRLMHRGGQRFDVLVFVAPLLDGQGRQTGWMGSMVDITERKRVREALRTSHERFTAVLEGMDAAVVVSDARSGEILFRNRRARDSYPDGAGSLLAERLHPHEQADEEVLNPADHRWYGVNSRPIRWVDGRAARIEFATDVTTRRDAEEISRQHLEKLQITSRLTTMGEMASTLAHELNQPLSAIANYCMGCVARLQSGAASQDELLAAMQKAAGQAQRAGKIIRRVREFVKKSAPQCSPCVINDIAEEAIGFAEIEAQKKGFAIERAFAPELPDVVADPIMIEQVLLNLVRNASEAMADNAPERRRVVVETRIAGDMVEVAVRDLGHGIAPGDVDKLFSPFFTTKLEGMGMGLSICRSIIEFHRGRLWADPNPEGGSVFRFTLPTTGRR